MLESTQRFERLVSSNSLSGEKIIPQCACWLKMHALFVTFSSPGN